uniref:F-box protein 41 n=1 Tax=Astyanax mexicanus TaxID=7994 RepID=A0A3B1IUW7_ASTMX
MFLEEPVDLWCNLVNLLKNDKLFFLFCLNIQHTMATTTSLSLHCPDCGEPCGFGDPQTGHTCRKICLIPRRKSEGAVVAVSAQQQCSPLGHSPISQPLRLELLDALSLASSAAVPLSQLLVRRHAPSFSPLMAVAVSAEPRSEQVVAQLNVPWGAWGRLAVEARLQQLALEVQHRVSSRLSSLQEEVKRRSVEVRRARRESERMEREKREAEQRAAELARQVDVSVEMLASLRQELMEREEELNLKHQEVCELDRFVRDTAFREASAKIRLQGFIEDLLERAERAEKQLQNLHTHSDTGSPHGHLVNRGAPYQVGHNTSRHSLTQGPLRPPSGLPTLRLKEIQTAGPSTPPNPRRTYTTADATGHTAKHSSIHCPSCHHSNKSSKSMMCSERMRMRAWLFCVFTYLDTRSLLTAAQVCRDWWSVARHPAVWTRVSLENARISSKFLVTLSQWCSQTQSLSLQNLKPRSRNRKESKEEYQKSTRGCLEVGLEAVLKSAGRSLLSLTISHCPNILTDRSLWLVSCHCRALRTLTYRSSSDPVGQEVIWALGAGCRDITNLHTAPLQPCQQPSRFSNRCLQTIGRCWPNLQQVGVGGAGCGIQGLASLVRNCAGVTVLELDHMSEISQEGAAELCREGLQHLHTLIFISTPVTPKALLHFNSVCVKLKNIVVQMSIADYFEDAESEEAKRLFEEIVSNLQALRKRPGLADILQIKVDRP